MTASNKKYTIEESNAFIETFNINPKGSGALNGLRFAVKDIIDIEGFKTSCGNPYWRDSHPVAVANAVCIDQLLYTGGQCIGKTVTDELAFSLDGESFFYGTPLNPKSPERVPGGSSSGSASAVACGLVDFAIGTDTGGSVRVPASNCGIFGMRPSHGFISVAGVNPLAPTFDTVGVFAHSSDILAKVASVLLACDVPSTVELGTVHLVKEAFAIADLEVVEALSAPIEQLRRIFGDKVKETSLREIKSDDQVTDLQTWLNTYSTIQWAEIWSCLGSWVENVKPEFGPRIKRNFELTKNLDRSKIIEPMHRRELYFQRLKTFLMPNDLLCIPTTPSIAPMKGSLGNDRTTCSYYPRALSLTSIAGIGRLPQVTLPLADVNGVPIGLSLLASHGQDAFLLGVVQMIASQVLQHMGDLIGNSPA